MFARGELKPVAWSEADIAKQTSFAIARERKSNFFVTPRGPAAVSTMGNRDTSTHRFAVRVSFFHSFRFRN